MLCWVTKFSFLTLLHDREVIGKGRENVVGAVRAEKLQRPQRKQEARTGVEEPDEAGSHRWDSFIDVFICHEKTLMVLFERGCTLLFCLCVPWLMMKKPDSGGKVVEVKVCLCKAVTNDRHGPELSELHLFTHRTYQHHT